MDVSKTRNFIKHSVCLLAILLLFPAVNAWADTTVNTSANGTIEVQAMVQEGFVEPITVELSGKDNYTAKLLITADNHYVLRKQLPNGSYTVTAVYTNTKAETDSQMWASSETVEITQGKTSVLSVAVLDDTDGNTRLVFGEENNPFYTGADENPNEFMAENAAKLEAQTAENTNTANETNNDTTVQNEPTNNQPNKEENNEENSTSDVSANTEDAAKTQKPQTAGEKLIDLITRLARYILLCVFIMAGVSGVVWVYRRMKYGE